MPPTKLQISPDLALPVDAMTEAIALLSTRGRGKTHTATVFAEEVLKLHHQVVIVDPVGLYWGLRSSKDGAREGYQILVLGGSHGDLPLQAADAATIAQFVVEEEASVVIDLSGFGTKGEQTRFLEVFFDRLWHLKARHRTPLLLVLEEAQEVAPQRPGPGEQVMLGRIERIAKLGRNYGIGLLMITQRPASLNKDVLDLAGILVLLGLVAPIERKVAREWISGHGDEALGKEILDSLPALPRGDAWLWWPLQGVLQRLHVRERETFDSSATPKVGEKRTEPGRRAGVDLDAFKAKLGGLIEKAKAEDPKELHRRIRELERQLATATRDVREVERVVEVPDLDHDAVRRLQAAIEEWMQATAHQALAGVDDVIAKALEGAPLPAIKEVPRVRPEDARPAASAPRQARRDPGGGRLPGRRLQQEAAVDVDGFRPSGSQQRILDALAWLEAVGLAPATRSQVAFLSGYTPNSGGFNNYLGALRSAGVITYPSSGMVGLTDPGRAIANQPDAPATTAALQEAIFGKLGASKAKILKALIDAYPGSLTREELAGATGYTANSGGFNNYLGSMRSLRLLDYPDRGHVAAQPVLFLEGS